MAVGGMEMSSTMSQLDRTANMTSIVAASSSPSLTPYSHTQSMSAQKLSKPVAVVEASVQSGPTVVVGDTKISNTTSTPDLRLSSLSVPSSSAYSQPLPPQILPSFAHMNNGDSVVNGARERPKDQSSSFTPISHIQAAGPSLQTGSTGVQNTFLQHPPSLAETAALSAATSQVSGANSAAQAAADDAHNEECVKSLQQENAKLKQDLDVQLQVNAELKRLLVASVGEDLSQRVERLCRDRAQLSMDIGGFSKKISEDYENLDKVSIQADMWRSKYLASRVMIEELGNARAFYSLQCHDSQEALQQLLNERHELRTNLLDTYKVLQQVKHAFDPLNSHRSSTLRSTNVLDLTRSCQQLAEAMRFRLLPAHVAVNIDDVDDDSWEDSVTRAEQFAHEVLSRPTEPTGSLVSGSSRLLPVMGSQESQVSRFHPHTRHENLTFNCCSKCKGDISVM